MAVQKRTQTSILYKNKQKFIKIVFKKNSFGQIHVITFEITKIFNGVSSNIGHQIFHFLQTLKNRF